MMAWNWLSGCDVLFTTCHRITVERVRRSLSASMDLDPGDLPGPRTPEDLPVTSSACYPTRS